MKRSSILFLQAVIILIGIAALVGLLWGPHFEGRNAHATLFEVYFNDPFLAYAYVASTAFFVALYQAFVVLRYAGQNNTFSPQTVKAFRTIKYCAVTLIAFIVGAEGYLVVIQRKVEEDIAGGVMMGLFLIFIAVIVAAAAVVLESIVEKKLEPPSRRV